MGARGRGGAEPSEGDGAPSDLEVRKWLYWKSQEDWHDQDLSDRDVQWIMGKENNQTLLLKFTPGTDGVEGKWDIKQGNYITLGELFRLGGDRVSCYDLYRTYLSLPAFLRKKTHSRSHTATAQQRSNAKHLRFAEYGRWGLAPRK